MAGHLALHGLCCTLPAGCEVVATYGEWRRGHLIIAAERTPRLALTWRRHRAAPNLLRTLAGAGRRLTRGDVVGEPAGQGALGADGIIGRWRSPGGVFHAGVRTVATSGVTLVARQLQPGTQDELGSFLGSVEAHGEDAPWPWRLYGLDADLPPWWRLEGVSQLAGLARAVWFHQPRWAARPDQVLVLRRLACASRVLAGCTLVDWVRSGLGRSEVVTSVGPCGDAEPGAGVVQMTTSVPARSWWGRIRGQRATRSLHAWIDATEDRLTLQEWTGNGEALPCLRQSAPASASPLVGVAS